MPSAHIRPLRIALLGSCAMLLAAPLPAAPGHPRPRGVSPAGSTSEALGPDGPAAVLQTVGPTPCAQGSAGVWPCRNVDLLSFMPVTDFGGAGKLNDIWGWTDPLTGREYALVGRNDATAFIDVTDPVSPVWIGSMPTQAPQYTSFNYRDIKVYGDHAIVVADQPSHGMQVFDLTRLRSVASPPVTFTPDAVYSGFGDAHNVAVDTTAGFAYPVSTDTCGGGAHITDIRTPAAPVFAGCIDDDGRTHDLECLTYDGPDGRFSGREICVTANEDSLNVYDVSDKAAPLRLAKIPYACSVYTHEGWFTEDRRYFLVGDEVDEFERGYNTRTWIFDLGRLDDPRLLGTYDGPSPAVDHNLYVHEGYAYEANYTSGLRIVDLADVHLGSLSEAGYFDVDPNGDALEFSGSWSVYPFFPSGTIAISVIEQGLFLVRAGLTADFVLEVDRDEVEVCDPGEGVFHATLRSRFGYTDPIAPVVQGLPQGASVSFSVNPVVPTGTTEVTVTTSGVNPGSDAFLIKAANGPRTRIWSLDLITSTTVPGAPAPNQPANGASSVSLSPILVWAPAAQATRYLVEVALDPSFSQVVLAETVEGTSLTVPRPLVPATTHHWRVTAANACGTGVSSPTATFDTRVAPPILLVDDDDNCPDVRPSYAAALNALGREFEVWDTRNSDDEPDAATLAPFDAVIWFTGGEFWFAAGPGPAAEGALASWLDASGCLLVTSQDYLTDHGYTPFIQNRLGVGLHNAQVGQTSVTGLFPFYTGLGPYALSFPYSNYTDRLGPFGGLTYSTFNGSAGSAATAKDTGVYRTNYWGFGFEAIPTAAGREDAMAAFLAMCDALPAMDGDGDGFSNAADCAPSDGGVWAAPEPARNLAFTDGTGGALAWQPPLDPGASVPLYDLLLSGGDAGFSQAACLASSGTATTAPTPGVPVAGVVDYYLVRTLNACGTALGETSAGVTRSAPACF